ncbi:zinc knuckle CX2CX4HX4C [Artemisia annua]|uniref:Zinc knuckle CX2CX4HX4C n=1 Tax=Artemisia annua TaxID=35608 RepID=A0A2U1MGV4_ARTAN|nr:zinc knuckle CX2CX4HX4C [Artemisia annua]
MDRMTTSICDKPYGRASFARVLVEIDSSKALVDNVELWYESLGKILKLSLEYTWVPPRCEECKVYGHYLSECAKKVNTVSKVNKDGDTVKPVDVKQSNNNDGAKVDDGDEGWQTATRRNFRNTGNNYRQGTAEHVLKIIVDTVRHKLMGLRIKRSREFGKAMAIWKFSVNGSNGSGRMGFEDGIDGVT